MKSREMQKLAKQYLLPHLKHYAAHGHLLIRLPADFFLCGYCFEGSSFAHDRFTVCAFVQPLYVPSDHIVLSYGKRLGNIIGKPEKWWEIDLRSSSIVMDDLLGFMQSQAEPILQSFDGAKSFIAHLDKLHTNEKDPWRQESIAYAHILTGDLLQARKALVRLLPYLEELILTGTLWAREIRERARIMLAYVEQGEVEAMHERLSHWRTYTIQHLKLDKLIKIQ
jgi:hypothetical protein